MARPAPARRDGRPQRTSSPRPQTPTSAIPPPPQRPPPNPPHPPAPRRRPPDPPPLCLDRRLRPVPGRAERRAGEKASPPHRLTQRRHGRHAIFFAFELEGQPWSCFDRVGAPMVGVGLLDPGELDFLAPGRVLGCLTSPACTD